MDGRLRWTRISTPWGTSCATESNGGRLRRSLAAAQPSSSSSAVSPCPGSLSSSTPGWSAEMDLKRYFSTVLTVKSTCTLTAASPCHHGRLAQHGGAQHQIHLLVDALGRLAAPFILTAGNISGHTAAPLLADSLRDTAAVADKGYDSKAFRDQLRAQECEPCISAYAHVRCPDAYDKELYRARHCIGNVFPRLNVFRRVAKRYNRTDRMFRLLITVALSAVYEKGGWGQECQQALKSSLI